MKRLLPFGNPGGELASPCVIRAAANFPYLSSNSCCRPPGAQRPCVHMLKWAHGSMRVGGCEGELHVHQCLNSGRHACRGGCGVHCGGARLWAPSSGQCWLECMDAHVFMHVPTRVPGCLGKHINNCVPITWIQALPEPPFSRYSHPE